MEKVYKLILGIIFFCFIITFSNWKVYAANELAINAKAGIIVETNTGKIIFDKDANVRNYPASVTKILTAIIAIENCNLNEIAIASEKAISNIPSGYVVTPLMIGEEMRIEDLLYALMLKSSNDAAYVLAEHVGGSIEGFSDMMNKKAKEIGCKNSHFVNPNGIHNENHYTTAYDMYLISNYAMKNETFANIVSTYKYNLPATNKYKNSDRVMTNTNSFINPNSSYYNKDVRGIKTGTTIQAGNCLITDSSKDGLEFITVLLGANTSEGKFYETNKMIKFSCDNYTLTEIYKKGDIITTIEVEKATEETKNLNLITNDKLTVMHNKEIKVDEIEPEIKLNENIIAPISAGQEIGTLKYNIDGLDYSIKLLAANDIEKKTYYKEICIIVGVVAFTGIVIIILKKEIRS